MTSPVVAVGGIAVVGDALLMVRRSNPPEAGQWTIPGGKVDGGESLAQAVERELYEETGLEVRCEGLRGWVERIIPGFHYVILDFDVAVTGGLTPTPGGDALEASWVPLDRVPSLETVSGLVDFLRDHSVLG